MKKRYALIPIGLIISLILAFSVHDNFSRYGGYYATQLPRGEGKHPELILIMKYLEHIPHPDNSQIRYDYDGVNTIVYGELYRISGNGTYININDWDESKLERPEYIFSDSGEYITTIYLHHRQNDTIVMERSTPEDEAEAYDLAYEIIQRLIDVQKAPPKGQNLQWLFNLIYQKQFE